MTKMIRIFSLLFILLIFMNSCNKKKQADLIIFNAKIYTVDSTFSNAEAFAVKDGKFIAVGKSNDILNNYESNKKIDLHNQTVFPGLIDAHCHFYGYGLSLQYANLRNAKSFEEVIEILKEHHKKFPSHWILGRGWDQNNWSVKEFPTNELLDKTFPDNPVLLIRIDGHAVVANHTALKTAGITTKSKIQGGDILQKNNKLTGVLLDNAADTLKKYIPKLNHKEKTNVLLQAQKNCFEVGLTTVTDAGLTDDMIELIDSLQKKGVLQMRICGMLELSEQNILKYLNKGKYKTDYLTIRSVKLYADGALGSRGAKLIKPYSDNPGNIGLLVLSPDSLEKICKMAFEKEFQVCTHCIGDSANRLMLSIYSKFLKPDNDLRWRIEHGQVIAPEDFQMFGKFKIIPSVQPTHATSDMYWAEKRLGAERIKGAYAYKQLLEQNGWIANGSDFPIEEINPLFGFYAAVVRKDQKGFPEKGFQIENALSREQALKAMTIWAAKANFEEKEKGSIEVGKFADFVVTSNDLMKANENELFQIKINMTFVNGKIVYQK